MTPAPATPATPARPRTEPGGVLADLLGDALDPAYAEVAARRSARGRSGSTRRRPVVAAVMALVVLGSVLGVAYATTQAEEPASARTRQALVTDVTAQSARVDGLALTLEATRTEVARARDMDLASSAEGRDAAATVRRLELASAVAPVSGPGITVTVSDAPAQEPDDPVSGQSAGPAAGDAGLVLDGDLQMITNAIWAAGAEAVSVDGHRLGPATSIRTAGQAILVDFLPVSSPYEIQAIGDPGTLLPRFVGSQTAARYAAYQQLYGIGFTAMAADELELPAGTQTELRYATPTPEAPR